MNIKERWEEFLEQNPISKDGAIEWALDIIDNLENRIIALERRRREQDD